LGIDQLPPVTYAKGWRHDILVTRVGETGDCNNIESFCRSFSCPRYGRAITVDPDSAGVFSYTPVMIKGNLSQ
jgi:hypothetical protein